MITSTVTKASTLNLDIETKDDSRGSSRIKSLVKVDFKNVQSIEAIQLEATLRYRMSAHTIYLVTFKDDSKMNLSLVQGRALCGEYEKYLEAQRKVKKPKFQVLIDLL